MAVGIVVVVIEGIVVVVAGMVVVVVDALTHLSRDSLQVVPPVQGLPLPAQESVASLQDSVPLQNKPSLGQLTGVPGMQVPTSQVSSPLQYVPSSQSATIEHPAASQVFASSLQSMPSAQGLPLLTQVSFASSQDSAPLQKVPSSGQPTGVPGWQPSIGSQTSLPLQN